MECLDLDSPQIRMEREHTFMCYTSFVSNRNLTLNLPVELVKKAKVYAAQHDTTVNALVRELLETAVSGQQRERAAMARFLDIAREVRTTADPGKIRREELHERW